MSNLTFDQVISLVSKSNKFMSNNTNTIIAENIADTIAQMRPDLAGPEVDQLFHDCWNELQDDVHTNMNKFIAAWGRPSPDFHEIH